MVSVVGASIPIYNWEMCEEGLLVFKTWLLHTNDGKLTIHKIFVKDFYSKSHATLFCKRMNAWEMRKIKGE